MARFRFLNPGKMYNEDVCVKLFTTSKPDYTRGFVPSYNFRIYDTGCREHYGQLGFRVGDLPDLLAFVGHIGYGIHEEWRGHGYAAKACLAVKPFVAKYYESVIITCNPDNTASRKTIEKLGATYVETVDVREDHPLYERGDHQKMRYEWRVR